MITQDDVQRIDGRGQRMSQQFDWEWFILKGHFRNL